MPVRVFKPPLSKPAPVYSRARAAAVPEAIAGCGPREHVPLTWLVKEWDDFPEEREEMIAQEPVRGDAGDICRVAAVVHALCDRDGVPVPGWVWRHRSPVPIAWGRSVPMTGFIWEQTIANAPPACAQHNVWFDYQFISAARHKVTKDDYQQPPDG